MRGPGAAPLARVAAGGGIDHHAAALCQLLPSRETASSRGERHVNDTERVLRLVDLHQVDQELERFGMRVLDGEGCRAHRQVDLPGLEHELATVAV